MFNTLKYSRILEAVGLSREQAEAHIQIVAEIVEGELATKQDIHETKQEIKALENKMDSKFEQMEYRLVIKLTAVLVPIVSLTIAITTFIMKHL